MDWPAEEGTKVVYGSQRSGDRDLKLRWPGRGFLISTRNCLKIKNALGGAGLIQEVVSACYVRHVSKEPRAPKRSFPGRADILTDGRFVELTRWDYKAPQDLVLLWKICLGPLSRDHGDSEMISSLWKTCFLVCLPYSPWLISFSYSQGAFWKKAGQQNTAFDSITLCSGYEPDPSSHGASKVQTSEWSTGLN